MSAPWMEIGGPLAKGGYVAANLEASRGAHPLRPRPGVQGLMQDEGDTRKPCRETIAKAAR